MQELLLWQKVLQLRATSTWNIGKTQGSPASNNHFVLEPASGIRDKATAEEEH